MPGTAAHMRPPVQWWKRMSVCETARRHLHCRATGGRAPMAAVAEAPTTAVGARPKEGKERFYCRTGSARRVFSSRSRAVEAAKEKALAFAAVAASVTDTSRCHRTQSPWWMTPRHWLATLTLLPRGTWHPRLGPRRARLRRRWRRLLPRRRLPASAGLVESDAAMVQDFRPMGGPAEAICV